MDIFSKELKDKINKVTGSLTSPLEEDNSSTKIAEVDNYTSKKQAPVIADTKNGFSVKLNAMIESAIADGSISEKERNVLHSIAEREGISADEIDVLVDGEIDKIKKENQAKKVSTKYGEIKKCPNCGAPVVPGTVQCKECGFFYTNLEINEFWQKFSDRISEAKEKLANVQEIAEIIRLYTLPTAKGDLIEFTTALIPLARLPKNRSNQANKDEIFIETEAFYNKLLDCKEKINTLFPDDPDFAVLIQKINELPPVKKSALQIISQSLKYKEPKNKGNQSCATRLLKFILWSFVSFIVLGLLLTLI